MRTCTVGSQFSCDLELLLSVRVVKERKKERQKEGKKEKAFNLCFLQAKQIRGGRGGRAGRGTKIQQEHGTERLKCLEAAVGGGAGNISVLISCIKSL